MRRIINRDPPRPHTLTLTHPNNSSNAPDSPDTTTDDGPFTAATPNRPPQPPTSSSTSAHTPTPPTPSHPDQPTPTQHPTTQRHHPRRILQRQPTRHTRRRDLPLRMTHHRPGPTPHDRHNPANDTITANNTGCTTSTRLQPRRTLHTPQHILNAPIHEPRQRLRHTPPAPPQNTVDESNNSTAIPSHCEPCPGNTNTAPPPTTPRTTHAIPATDSPAANAPDPQATPRDHRPPPPPRSVEHRPRPTNEHAHIHQARLRIAPPTNSRNRPA